MPHRDGLHAGEGDLRRRLGGAYDLAQSGAARSFGDGERAGHGPDPPVERELADRRVAGKALRRKLARRGQDGE